MKQASMVTLGIIFLLMPISLSALSQSYETSTVARIVGDSPEEMMGQLDSSNLELQHATLYSDDRIYSKEYGGRASDINQTLNALFPDESNVNFVPSNAIGGLDGWDWEDAESGINNANKRDFIIIESRGEIENNELKAASPKWLDADLTPNNLNWNTEKKPLLLFDSDYAGIHLPSFPSYVAQLAKDAIIIAPTAFPDKEFVKAFACSLKNSELGTLYRNARNNYYWSSRTPSGLALMSYELYGDPTVNVSIPEPYGDREQYCEGFFEDYSEKIKSGSLYVDISFSLKNYSIIRQDNFSLLSVNNTDLSLMYGELPLPYLTKTTEFPLRTIILNYAYQLSDPVNLTIPDLPSWEGGLVNRTCWEDNKSAGIGFSLSFTEDKEAVIAAINPVEIINCTRGDITLWRQINYSITYEPYSPVIISSLDFPQNAKPDEDIGLMVNVKKVVLDDEITGTLVLSSNNQTVVEKDVLISQPYQNFNLSFYAAHEEGTVDYTVLFVQENATKTSSSFAIETSMM